MLMKGQTLAYIKFLPHIKHQHQWQAILQHYNNVNVFLSVHHLTTSQLLAILSNKIKEVTPLIPVQEFLCPLLTV